MSPTNHELAVQDLPIELVHIDNKKMPADFLSGERNDKNYASAADLRDMEVSDALEHYLVHCVQESYEELEELKPMSLKKIKEVTKTDTLLQFLKDRIQKRDFYMHRNIPRIKNDYYPLRAEFSVIDDLIIRGAQRIVLPSVLHAEAISLVHKLAHMGMTNTEELLNSIFGFPGYSCIVRADIEWCDTCKKILISKRKEPGGTFSFFLDSFFFILL